VEARLEVAQAAEPDLVTEDPAAVESALVQSYIFLHYCAGYVGVCADCVSESTAPVSDWDVGTGSPLRGDGATTS
jgi:hypothetical protein